MYYHPASNGEYQQIVVGILLVLIMSREEKDKKKIRSAFGDGVTQAQYRKMFVIVINCLHRKTDYASVIFFGC